MPLKVYCQSCGSPTEYSGIIPRFCALCGVPFANSSSAAIIKTQPAKEKIPTPEKIEIYTEDDDNPSQNVEELDCEVHVRRVKDSFDNLMSQKPNPDNKRNISKKKVNKKQFLQDFQKEASKSERIQID